MTVRARRVVVFVKGQKLFQEKPASGASGTAAARAEPAPRTSPATGGRVEALRAYVRVRQAAAAAKGAPGGRKE